MFIAKFNETFELDLVKETVGTAFLGLCEFTKLGDDPRTLHLWPNKEEYRAVKAQLQELKDEGALVLLEEIA